MEKQIEVMLSKIEYVLDFVSDMVYDVVAEVIDSIRHHFWQLLIQIIGSISGIYMFLQDKISYSNRLHIDDAFIEYIVPCIVGSAIYAVMAVKNEKEKKSDTSYNKFIIFVISIAFSAFSIQGLLEIFKLTPSRLYYSFGGFIMFPVLEFIIYTVQYLRKEGPKLIIDVIKNKFGVKKEEEEESNQN